MFVPRELDRPSNPDRMLLPIVSVATVALMAPDALQSVGQLLDAAYPSSYAERLMLGRQAQLGNDLVYRPGAIGCTVDSALTYGEYDLGFFSECVERALEGAPATVPLTFVDVGSGVGRLTLAAALLWPQRFKRCAGVERVASLHKLACDAERRAAELLPADAPVRQFVCGDAAEALSPTGELADADVLFAYSSTWPSEGAGLSDFSAVCGTCLRVGSRVVTTDRQLCSVDGLWRFELLDSLEGVNHETGGTSVGYVHEVVQSRRE